MKKPKITEGNWKIEYDEKVGGYQIVSDVIIAKRIRSQDAKAIAQTRNMIDALVSVHHSMMFSRADSGAVILGDALEEKIEQVLLDAGCEL